MIRRYFSKAKKSESGVALVAVLWITSLLALMAAGTGSSGRLSSRLAFNAIGNTKAKLLAEAGINKAIYDLLTTDVGLPWTADGAHQNSFRLGGEHVVVQVRDEDGKVNLNAAPPELLAGLFAGAGLELDAANTLAERIVNKRDGLDPDDADIQPFHQVDDLAKIPGITRELYKHLRPHVTIYADADGFDPLRASTVVLGALPGMTPEALAALQSSMSISTDNASTALPKELTATFGDYFLPSRKLVFEVRALGQTDSGGRFLQETIIALDGGINRMPFTTYAWRRGALARNDPLLRVAPRPGQ